MKRAYLVVVGGLLTPVIPTHAHQIPNVYPRGIQHVPAVVAPDRWRTGVPQPHATMTLIVRGSQLGI